MLWLVVKPVRDNVAMGTPPVIGISEALSWVAPAEGGREAGLAVAGGGVVWGAVDWLLEAEAWPGVVD